MQRNLVYTPLAPSACGCQESSQQHLVTEVNWKEMVSPDLWVIIEVTQLVAKKAFAFTLFDKETLFPPYIGTETKQSQTK